MKKGIIIIVLVITLFATSCQEAVDYDQLKLEFETLLSSGDYSTANSLYENAEDERITYYNQSLDVFAAQLIANSSNDLTSQDAKSALNNFLIFEYTKPQIQQAIDDINIYQEKLAASNAHYSEAMVMIDAREFDKAYEKLSLVDEIDENYQNALDTMAELQIRINMWEDAKSNSLTGRNPYKNSLAYKDGYVYFPVDVDNVHSIVKHNYSTGQTELLPIMEFVGTYHIKGINVIGDYLYFIAGEELGKGTMLESPYNIYEMKTDGTGLTMVKSGDYFDLISFGDTFYALSYSKGLVKMDKYFGEEEVISDKWIIEMQATDKGLYYTEKLANTYDTQHVLYLYSNGESTEIMRDDMLHVYFFDNYSIYYRDRERNPHEEIYYADLNLENEYRLATLIDGGKNSDILGFIGSLDGKVMINTSGWLSNAILGTFLRQPIYSEVDIENKKVNRLQNDKKAPPYFVTNVLYEEGVMLVVSDEGVYSLTASPSENEMDHVIELPDHSAEMLSVNMAVTNEYRPGDDDFYTDEEVVFELEDFWYYSSPNLNVTIERIYEEHLETSIYVSTIRTKDNTGFSLGYSNLEPPGEYTRGVKTDDFAQINQAVFATNGDFAMLPGNPWAGKILRDGRVFDGTVDYGLIEFTLEKVYDNKVNSRDYIAMYPDGNMVAYRNSDEITVGELLDAGVKDTLAFGPILVYEDEQTKEVQDILQYLGNLNPRCAWGMVEPGHYVNLVVDGRRPDINRGITLYSMSAYFQDLGCSVAYNLDGGQTAAVAFMGRFLNTHQYDYKFTNHRPVQEIIYFGKSDLVPYDLVNYYEE